MQQCSSASQPSKQTIFSQSFHVSIFDIKVMFAGCITFLFFLLFSKKQFCNLSAQNSYVPVKLIFVVLFYSSVGVLCVLLYKSLTVRKLFKCCNFYCCWRTSYVVCQAANVGPLCLYKNLRHATYVYAWCDVF